MHGGYFVQVSDASEPGWVTVAAYETRAAARADADGYRSRCDARGVAPKHVRLVSAARLPRQGGDGRVVRDWARAAFAQGATISEIADALRIDPKTARSWARGGTARARRLDEPTGPPAPTDARGRNAAAGPSQADHAIPLG